MQHIPRKENVKADALSLFAFSENELCSGSIYYQVFKTSSIDANMVALVDTEPLGSMKLKCILKLDIYHLMPRISTKATSRSLEVCSYKRDSV